MAVRGDLLAVGGAEVLHFADGLLHGDFVGGSVHLKFLVCSVASGNFLTCFLLTLHELVTNAIWKVSWFGRH